MLLLFQQPYHGEELRLSPRRRRWRRRYRGQGPEPGSGGLNRREGDGGVGEGSSSSSSVVGLSSLALSVSLTGIRHTHMHTRTHTLAHTRRHAHKWRAYGPRICSCARAATCLRTQRFSGKRSRFLFLNTGCRQCVGKSRITGTLMILARCLVQYFIS